jgi:hypothetical protein
VNYPSFISTKQREKATTWRPRDSLFDFRVSVRVSKPDFPRILCSSFKLFEHQTVRSSRVHCIYMCPWHKISKEYIVSELILKSDRTEVLQVEIVKVVRYIPPLVLLMIGDWRIGWRLLPFDLEAVLSRLYALRVWCWRIFAAGRQAGPCRQAGRQMACLVASCMIQVSARQAPGQMELRRRKI